MGLWLCKMWLQQGHGQNEQSSSVNQPEIPSTSSAPTKFIPPPNWANAPEFHPTKARLCTHAMDGKCHFGVNCKYLHGSLCELCGRHALHPYDEVKRKKHVKQCMAAHKKNMEYSFKIAEQMEKECGICKAIVRKKQNSGGNRFGIMSDCNHCFCITCIRNWRRCKEYPESVHLGCPVCRVVSKDVIATRDWVENGKEKDKLFRNYFKRLSKIPCKRAKAGKCPFRGLCHYSHSNVQASACDANLPRVRHTMPFEPLDFDWEDWTNLVTPADLVVGDDGDSDPDPESFSFEVDIEVEYSSLGDPEPDEDWG